jgi:hypothetical protein
LAAGAGACRRANGEREEVADATNVLLLRRFNRFGRLENPRQFLNLISCFKKLFKSLKSWFKVESITNISSVTPKLT